jgi:hypothetical protein
MDNQHVMSCEGELRYHVAHPSGDSSTTDLALLEHGASAPGTNSGARRFDLLQETLCLELLWQVCANTPTSAGLYHVCVTVEIA